MDFIEQLNRLEEQKAGLAALERTVAKERQQALAALPADFGYADLKSFLGALKAAAGKVRGKKGKVRGKKGKVRGGKGQVRVLKYRHGQIDPELRAAIIRAA